MNYQTKRNYHPLIIVLFASGMLSLQELNEIPRTTKYNWRQFNHNSYYGHHLVESYIKQFDDIKDVFQSKFTARAIKTILKTRRGFYNMLGELAYHKNLLKRHANSIVTSIEDMAEFSRVTITKACKFYGISKDWYYAQKRKIVCKTSLFKKCYRQYPNQLTLKEVVDIEHLVKQTENFKKPITTIYYNAIRKGLINCGITTFRKYANALGYIKSKPSRAKAKKGFKASYVFEWLHIDITNVQTIKDGIQKVAFVKDNFSSGLLHYKSTSEKTGSLFIKQLLKETFEKYNLYNRTKDIHILSDGGSENKGEVLSWVKHINAPPVVKKITAMTEEFPFSNAMSEITHSIYKSEFMGGKPSEDKASHIKSLDAFMEYYNHYRYPCRLYGKTPMEIISGQKIDKLLFSDTLKKAKANRLEVNGNFNKCMVKIGCKRSQ
ncbi:hypothetical protein [Winogradskyella luteola]|uniref:Integrase catalytic domain-containing protein n=1 Tax=Winogradskyella luteola TaxID=2828330 RepID=A0A9X1FBD3_9FLAO|nr:hypothetical protein [Winogradskyella luteola]MBV7270735.1 hypothetical protein [Winogradskyella luteola]